jgi:N-acetyl-anhydromuramyl-L-alanine amidase AmpD
MQIINSINNEHNPKRSLTDIKSVVLHHTGSAGTDEANKKYLNKDDYVSAHYLIGKDGKVYQLMDDNIIAYHAGVSSYKGLETKNNSLNWCTLGIEINSNGFDFTDEQKKSVKELAQFLMKKYNIPYTMVLGHKNIAPGRKVDPGIMLHQNLSWENYQKSFNFNFMDENQKQLCESIIYALKNGFNFGTEEMKELASKNASEWREILKK